MPSVLKYVCVLDTGDLNGLCTLKEVVVKCRLCRKGERFELRESGNVNSAIKLNQKKSQ